MAGRSFDKRRTNPDRPRFLLAREGFVDMADVRFLELSWLPLALRFCGIVIGPALLEHGTRKNPRLPALRTILPPELLSLTGA